MKIAVIVGHSKLKGGSCTSADGRKFGGVNEYAWNKAFSRQLIAALKAKGHKVTRIVCPEGKFESVTYLEQERDYKFSIVNDGTYDLVIELHCNAGDPKAEGVEVVYKSAAGKVFADKIQKALATVFENRGTKQKDVFYILNGTKAPAIIIESFFCTSKSDYKKARGLKNRTKIAKLIAGSI